MVAGERVRFWVDADEAAGRQARARHADRASSATRSSSLQIEKGAEPPPVPPDVAKPPADAKKTAQAACSTRCSRRARAARSRRRPTPCACNYTGWTTDGKMFDSSVINATSRRSSACRA